MNREEAKQALRNMEPDFLEEAKMKVRGKPTYICPKCGNGSGENGDGIVLDHHRKDGNHYHCFVCGLDEDIIGLWKIANEIPDDKTAFESLYSHYGMAVESSKPTAWEDFQPQPEYQKQAKNERYTQETVHTDTYTQGESKEDYTNFFLQANKALSQTDYHRGLSIETLNRFKVGFIPNWKHPKAGQNVAPTPRLIIPTSKGSYLARDTRSPLDIPEQYRTNYEKYSKMKVGGQNVAPTPRLIIPTSKGSYLARDTRSPLDIPEQYRTNYEKYSKMKVGGVPLFNVKALDSDRPVFITEGELDAMSIEEVGAPALGLGTIGNIEKLLKLLQEKKPAQPLILALDGDNAGQEATERLVKGLQELGIPFYRPAYKLYGSAKDANSFLCYSKEQLGVAVFTAIKEALEATESALEAQREEYKKTSTAHYLQGFVDGITDSVNTPYIFTAIKEALEATESALEAQREEYKKTSTAHYLQGFVDGITDSVNTPYIATGFPVLDNILDGGLYEGLYFLGAISSLGKTTLALQIADQIAEAGKDVLIFSLEMARNELIAKSISRLTIMDVLQNDGDTRNAKTTRGITTGTKWANYSKTEIELIQRAITAYSGFAEHIYIQEGIGNIGTEQIKKAVEDHILFTGNKPVVLIDYVQILAPNDPRATDKQNTDKAVLELKRISRDFKIPVIGISSFNRDSYKNAVSMEAFKESGALEYGSDVLIGLQLKGAGTKGFDVNEAKDKNPREVELVVLKNRNGATGKKVEYSYYPMFNYFKEV